jgi:hypothetical protein
MLCTGIRQACQLKMQPRQHLHVAAGESEGTVTSRGGVEHKQSQVQQGRVRHNELAWMLAQTSQ